MNKTFTSLGTSQITP